MNPDDDRYLSAFLDGDLTPEQRLRVDSAIRSAPDLAERCRDLGRVNEWVAGLSRPPAERDQSEAILAELRRRRSVFYWIGWFERPPITKSLALFGAAASLVACAALGLTAVSRFANDRAVDYRVAAIPPVKAVELGSQLAVSDDKKPLKSAEIAQASNQPTGKQDSLNVELEQVRALLLGTGTKQRFIVNDVIGADSSAWIGRHLKRMDRHNHAFAHIHLKDENLVDPEHPGEAEVFVVVVDPQEMTNLKSDLDGRFHEKLSEASVDDEMVGRLAQLDDSLLQHGRQIANFVVPPDATTARKSVATPKDESRITFVLPRGEGDRLGLHSTADSDASSEPPPEAAYETSDAPADGAEADQVASDEPLQAPGETDAVLYIWVKTRGANAYPGPR